MTLIGCRDAIKFCCCTRSVHVAVKLKSRQSAVYIVTTEQGGHKLEVVYFRTTVINDSTLMFLYNTCNGNLSRNLQQYKVELYSVVFNHYCLLAENTVTVYSSIILETYVLMRLLEIAYVLLDRTISDFVEANIQYYIMTKI